MIAPFSRYVSASETRNGVTYVVAKRPVTYTPNYISHTARRGETMADLAKKYLGTPVLYWRIADINPQVPFPDIIEPGTKIRIPQ